MPYDKFYIGSFNSGLQTDVKPFRILNNSFERLLNVYQYRDRIRKRFGTRYMNSGVATNVAQLFSRARMTVGIITTNASSGMVPGSIFQIGQLFSIGTNIFTVYQAGTPADMLIDGTATTATYDTTDGSFSFTGVIVEDNTPIYWYPADPIMGLPIYETADSVSDPTYAFDTQFSYQFNPSNSGGWDILGPLPPALGSGQWTGTNSDFFWATNWQGDDASVRNLFVTNDVPPTFRSGKSTTDGIQYWNNSVWTNLNPALSATDVGTTNGSGNITVTVAAAYRALGQQFIIGQQGFIANLTSGALITYGLGAAMGTYNTTTGVLVITGATINTIVYAADTTLQTALIVETFKNYLVAFSPTINIGTTVAPTLVQYKNQAIWAAFGDPTAPGAWRQDMPGLGNSANCSTMQDITSAEFLKDRLDIEFERSTYEFAWTGNYADPFVFQKLNTELGTESTFSTIPFDQEFLSVGNVGIHKCNGVNVERIDNAIPFSVWNIRTGQNQVDRVYGIRDFFAEQAYWTFPNNNADENNMTFPNTILCYNYLTQAWAIFDESITVFGHFYEAAQSAVTWSSNDITWSDDVITWGSGDTQDLNQVVLAGNQEGFIFIVDINKPDQDALLQITNIVVDMSGNTVITCVNHNINPNDCVFLQNLNGLTGPFLGIYIVNMVVDSNTFMVIAPDIRSVIMSGQIYIGGGTIARVPRMDMLTKQFNFYLEQDRNASVARIDFLVDTTTFGEMNIDYRVNTSVQGLVQGSKLTGTLLGNSVLTTSPYDPALYPYEQFQEQLLHPIYPIAEGAFIQLHIYQNDVQLANSNIVNQDFQMHSMCFYVTPTGRAQ
jgi:hypothetical protein